MKVAKMTKFRGEEVLKDSLESLGKRFELVNLDQISLDFLEDSANATRFIWNLVLEWRKTLWQQWRITPSLSEINSALTEAKKTEGFEWLKNPPSECLQQKIRDLNTAYSRYFKKGGFPRFKSKKSNGGMSFRLPRLNSRKIEIVKLSKKTWKISGISKIGSLKFRGSDKKGFISEIINKGDITSLTFSKEGNKWYVSICYLKPIESEMLVEDNPVGIDRGIAISYALSSEKIFNLPVEKIKKIEEKISSLQRKTRRQKKGSNNKQKTFVKISKLHKDIKNIRKDFLNKTTTTIVKSHNLVVLENLKIGNMSKSASGTIEKPGKMVRQKSGLNKSILRQGWHTFETLLSYKLKRQNGILIKVAPYHTSNTCSKCSHVDSNSRIAQALFVCTNCGFEKNADINASIEILARGLRDKKNDCGDIGVDQINEAVTSLVL